MIRRQNRSNKPIGAPPTTQANTIKLIMTEVMIVSLYAAIRASMQLCREACSRERHCFEEVFEPADIP
jgi:hypothetical protein